MDRATCSRRGRDRIGADVRRSLARHASFSCSICGRIPVVIHHIEEWSTSSSNDPRHLIPVCVVCHQHIHGEGGSLYSKADLYDYKAAPTGPVLLSQELPLGRKTGYSFFVGDNFIACGERASLFRFTREHSLVSVDTSSGSLRLSILAALRDNTPEYLIRDNVLLIDTRDAWDVHYSGSALRVWRLVNGRKVAFVDLVIRPQVIILRRLSTVFNGKPFVVHKPRAPHRRQVERIAAKVREFENVYRARSAEIDGRPRTGRVFGGTDVDAMIDRLDKDWVRTRLEQYLTLDFCAEFKWDYSYYRWVLSGVLRESPVFGRGPWRSPGVPPELGTAEEAVWRIRARYAREFQELAGVVTEYDGATWVSNVSL